MLTMTKMCLKWGAAILGFLGFGIFATTLISAKGFQFLESDFSTNSEDWRYGPASGAKLYKAEHRLKGGFPDGFVQGTTLPGPKRQFDLAIVLDTTGSMGDVLDSVRSSLHGIVNQLDDADIDLRISVVSFSDTETTDYPLRFSNFSDNVAEQIATMNNWKIQQGGDPAEDVYLGIDAALDADWRDEPNIGRGIIVISDNPPKQNDIKGHTTISIAARATDANISIYPIVLSHDRETLAPYEKLATLTGGSVVESTQAANIDNLLLASIEASIDASEPLYWHAPAAFINLNHKQLLAFSVQTISGRPDLPNDIVLIGAELSLTYDIKRTSTGDWIHKRVYLNEIENWRVLGSQRQPTNEEMMSVLSNLRALLIRGERRRDGSVSGLDNVLLIGAEQPTPLPEIEGLRLQLNSLQVEQGRVPAGQWLSDHGPIQWTGEASGHIGTLPSSGIRLYGSINNDRSFHGYWVANTTDSFCAEEREGSYNWGAITIQFDKFFTTFEANSNRCNQVLNESINWNGLAANWKAPSRYDELIILLKHAQKAVEDYPHLAQSITETATEWMHSLYEHHYQVEQFYDGRQLYVMDTVVTQAISSAALTKERISIGLGRSHEMQKVIQAVEAAEEYFRILNGEVNANDSDLLRSVEDAYLTSAVIFGSMAAAIVAPPIVLEGGMLLAPLAAETVIAASGRTLYVVATHPVESEMAAEFIIGSAFAILNAGGPEFLISSDAWYQTVVSAESGMEIVLMLLITRGQSVPKYRQVKLRVEAVDGDTLTTRVVDIADLDELPTIHRRDQQEGILNDLYELAAQSLDHRRQAEVRRGLKGVDIKAMEQPRRPYQDSVNQVFVNRPREKFIRPKASLVMLRVENQLPTQHHNLPRRSRSGATEGILHSEDFILEPLLGSSRSRMQDYLPPGFENQLREKIAISRGIKREFILQATKHCEIQAIAAMNMLAAKGIPVRHVYLDINHHTVCKRCLNLKPYLENLMPPDSQLFVRPIRDDGSLGEIIQYSGNMTGAK